MSQRAEHKELEKCFLSLSVWISDQQTGVSS